MTSLTEMNLAGVALALLLGAAAFALYRRTLRGEPARRRIVLPTLRGLAVAAVALMLAQPTVTRTEEVVRRGQVTILDDRSASMTFTDPQMRPGRKLRILRQMNPPLGAGVNFALADFADRLEAQPDAAALGAIADDFAALDPASLPQMSGGGRALAELWKNVPGYALADVVRDDTFARPPTTAETITELRLPRDVGDDYVRRVRGRLRPAESGAYAFHLSADAAAQFSLADDGGAVRPILATDERTLPDDFAANVSPPVRLNAGEQYPFELVQKEGDAADHLTLAWSRDGGAATVIGGDALALPADAVSPAAERDRLAAALRDDASRGARVLAELFDDYAAERLAAGDAATVAAVAAFDAVPRRARAARVASAVDGVDAELVARGVTAGDATDLAAALASVAPAGDRPQAAVLLSDGRHNADASAEAAAARLAARGVRVIPVLVGSPLPPRDLAVLEAIAPATVHRDDSAAGRVVLLDTMPPGLAFAVTIGSADGEIWRRELTTTGEGRREIDFSFPVAEPADRELARIGSSSTDGEVLLPLGVEVEVIDGEARSDNNAADLPLRVTLGRGKVLVVDGRPRWETRYLVSLLGRDERWQITSALGPNSNGDALRRGADAFPESRAALLDFDAIVLGEVPAAWWRGDELQWLRDFVDERGGGLLLIDGDRGRLAEYADTPLGPLIPVGLDGDEPAAARLRLTQTGSASEALRLRDDAEGNAELWSTLPPPRRVARATPRPGAEVLAEAMLADGSATPAVVASRFGRGTVWYQSFDEVWRWRLDAGDEWQGRYWSGVLNRLAEPPFASEDEYAGIGLDKAAAKPGEAVTVRARFRDVDGEAAAALSARAVVRRDGRDVATVALVPDASGGGLFTATFGAPADAGVYEVSLAADGYDPADLTARARLLVRRPAAVGELARLDADDATMRSVADAAGGTMLYEEQAARLPALLDDLTTRRDEVRRYDLWTGWPLFATVIALLGVEWFLRRRAGLA